ncbi:MAG: hypothetical protein RLZZ65_1077 [Bacteroidota bacterium]|jgi:uncharacterized protein (TIGR00661 family)
MKILYAIQGTGNGHLSRAHELVPILSKYAHVETLISGNQSQIKAEFELNYQKTGLTFLSGKNGDISIIKSLRNTHPIEFFKEIKSFPIQSYDLVISDFEPVSAWSALVNRVPCIELSHQAGVLHPNAPKPSSQRGFGQYVLKHYVPSKIKYGFHFEAYDNHVFTPVIRREIRTAQPSNLEHYTVYLPGYHDDVLMHFLRQFPVKWEVFSKHANYAYRVDNVFFEPISQQRFQESLLQSAGVLCGAGFELPAEALFLGKKVLVIPMKGHYEQRCNALGAEKVGATTIPELDLIYHRQINYWLNQNAPLRLEYKDQSELVLLKILENFEGQGKQAFIEDKNFETVLEKLRILRYLL